MSAVFFLRDRLKEAGGSKVKVLKRRKKKMYKIKTGLYQEKKARDDEDISRAAFRMQMKITAESGAHINQWAVIIFPNHFFLNLGARFLSEPS